MAEAVVQLRKGLELLAGLPETDQRWRQELDLQVALGVALMATQGWAATEAGRANARARKLCEQIGSTTQLWPVLYGEWVFHAVRAEHVAARRLADELLRRAQDHQDAAAMIVGHRVVGTGALWRGELAGARRAFEQSLALYNSQQHGSLGLLYVQDPRVAALSGLSWTLFALGYPEQAQARSDDALDAARELAHVNTLAYALLFRSFLAQMRRARGDAQNQAEALVALATEQDIPHFLGAATMVRGWALTEAGETEPGLAQLRKGLPAWRASGAALYEPYFLSLQAEAHARGGSVKKALDLVGEALSRVNETGERWLEAELHRMTGELMLRLPDQNVAGGEAGLSRAVAVARQQGAKMWEVRAAVSLARLWIDQNRRNDARQLLAPLCGKFTEGCQTRDLQIAEAILRESAPPSTAAKD
jgi:predicted ATPase